MDLDAPTGAIVELGNDACEEEEDVLRGVTLHPLFPRLLQALSKCKMMSLMSAAECKALEQQTKASMEAIEIMVVDANKGAALKDDDPDLTEYLNAYITAAEAHTRDLGQLLESVGKQISGLEGKVQGMQSGEPESLGAIPKSVSKDGDCTEVLTLKRKYTEHINILREELSNKKRKAPLPEQAHNALRTWMKKNFAWPYPTEQEKAELCMETGLQKKQVNDWFVNTRKREWSKHFGKEGPPKDRAEAYRILLSLRLIKPEVM